MDVPETVRRALEDRPVADRVALEAGAGVGNGTVGLLDAGAAHVVAITNDRSHATDVRERIGTGPPATVLEADLTAIPLPDDSIEVVTAHALFNVLPVEVATDVAAELTRVAAPGAHLVVDDYDPMPADSPVRRLFAVENAAAELAGARPALTFYPAEGIRRLFAGHGWTHERTRSVLEPVPWTEAHLAAHAAEVEGHAEGLPDRLGRPLVDEANRLAAETGSSDEGRMYSLAMVLE